MVNKPTRKPPPAPPPAPSQTDVQRVMALYEWIAPIFEGSGSAIQGNVIAMLLGTWLHGHRAIDGKGSVDWEKTREIRGNLMVLTTKAGFAYANDRDRSLKEAEDETGEGTGKRH
jgi:hypothetical protein